LPFPGRAQQPPAAKKTAPAKKAQSSGPLEALWRTAEQALDKEDFAAAAKALEEFISYRPEDPYARFQLGYAYTGLKRWEDAHREYTKATELDPRLAAAYLNLGLLHLDREPAAAVAPLERAVELMPGEARPRFLLGLAHERAGNAKAAIESYSGAREIDGKNFDIRFALARTMLASKDAAGAEAEFRTALEIRADSDPARLGLAEALLAQDKGEPAAREFAAYLERHPEDAESREQLARLYVDLGKCEGSLAEVDRLVAAGRASASLYALQADCQVKLEKFTDAAESLTKALALEPTNARLHARLGRIRLEQRDFPAAEKALREALRFDPMLTEALRDLAMAFYLAENYPAALGALDELAKREALPAGSWFVRAICYDKLQMKPEALAAYKMFVELDQGRSERQDFQSRQRIRILTRELERKR
jgi:Flp pilus assembly protein TadD